MIPPKQFDIIELLGIAVIYGVAGFIIGKAFVEKSWTV